MAQSLGKLERWEGGFPGTHKFSGFDNLDPSLGISEMDVFFEAAQKLREQWGGNKFAGLYMHGTPGTGKTFAAIALGRALHDEIGAEVHYRFGPSVSSDSDWDVSTRYPASLQPPFPLRFTSDASRNPKSVLIYDEYKPEQQPFFNKVVEAAAQYGGLIIATSNHCDPFDLVKPQADPSTAVDNLALEVLRRENPQKAAGIEKAQQAERAKIAGSLLSRITHGFKFINMSGPDLREKDSFWG